MLRQFELVERVSEYIQDCDEAILNKAYVFALTKHQHQKRASGEPYFIHPLSVAAILAEKKMDIPTILTGLLHDTVEDTDATLEEIQEKFGEEVKNLVDGVTKIDEVNKQLNKQAVQGENLRKLILASLQDVRVLIVKLADRLHNMRTLNYIQNFDKKSQKAQETIDIYVPLSERIGLKSWGDEMADIAFQVLDNQHYEYINNRLDELYDVDEVERIISNLNLMMEEINLPCQIRGRKKHPYSIYNKMHNKHMEIENLSDIMAFRIITDNVMDCYKALCKVHEHCKVMPGRFKDYISSPKSNGYQSIHTIVNDKLGKRIEVQIRTREMHQFAEYGIAAHWAYKHGTALVESRQDSLNFLKQIIDSIDDGNSVDFKEIAKLSLYKDKIFVFTPKHEMKELPVGASVLDFAYALHERKIGNKYDYAKVNGARRLIDTKLKTGDTIEIFLNAKGEPKQEWLSHVSTHRAKNAINRRLRELNSEQNIKIGRDELYRLLNEYGLQIRKSHLQLAYKAFNAKNSVSIFQRVGEGIINAKDVLVAMFPHYKNNFEVKNISSANPIIVNNFTPGAGVKFSTCCLPIPGDNIIGFVNLGESLTIHRQECPKTAQYKAYPDRMRVIRWEKRKNYNTIFTSEITLNLGNRPGMLSRITNIIAEFGCNISDLKFIERNSDYFKILTEVEVIDLNQLQELMKAMAQIQGISDIKRVIAGEI